MMTNRWKSTVREGVAATVSFLPVFVLIGNELNWQSMPKAAGVLAVASAIATGLASPAGKEWLKKYVKPETGYTGKRRLEDKDDGDMHGNP